MTRIPLSEWRRRSADSLAEWFAATDPQVAANARKRHQYAQDRIVQLTTPTTAGETMSTIPGQPGWTPETADTACDTCGAAAGVQCTDEHHQRTIGAAPELVFYAATPVADVNGYEYADDTLHITPGPLGASVQVASTLYRDAAPGDLVADGVATIELSIAQLQALHAAVGALLVARGVVL